MSKYNKYLIALLALPLLLSAAYADIIVDNGDPGTTFTNKWCLSALAGYNGSTSLYNCGTPATYRWTPAIVTTGEYDVYVWWPSNPNRSASVPTKVVYGANTAVKYFNHQQPGNQWVLHGRYPVGPGENFYVEVVMSSGIASADAVKFVLVTP